MFSAFSSIDYQSIRASTPAETAVKRLNGIGEVLSGLDISAIHSQDDMAHALWTLDTADKCIRMILTEFRTERTKDVARERQEPDRSDRGRARRNLRPSRQRQDLELNARVQR